MSRGDPADLALLRLELRRYTTRCDSQQRMIERADSLREVSRLSSTTVPSSLYTTMEARDAQRHVVQAAEDRAKALINDQIGGWLKAEPEYREKHRANMFEEWSGMSGTLGHLRTWAQRQFNTAEQNRI